MKQRLADEYDTVASMLWAPVAAALRVPRRFVIMTSGRSGSELLVSLLDAHPDLVCEGEMLQRPRRSPRTYLRGHALRMVLRARAGGARPRVHGWKLITNHVRWYPDVFPEPQVFVEHLAATGTIIHLRRRNLLNQSLSLISAERTQYHVRAGESAPAFEPFVVEPERLLAQLYHYEEDDAWLTKTVGDVPHLDLTYEDHSPTGPRNRPRPSSCSASSACRLPTSTPGCSRSRRPIPASGSPTTTRSPVRSPAHGTRSS